MKVRTFAKCFTYSVAAGLIEPRPRFVVQQLLL